MNIETRLINLLSDNGFQITMDNLYYPLDFDSLKYMELLILIEEELEIDLDELDFVSLNTFKDLVDFIVEKYEENKR
ncbi:phosphopantetheine-binding protein [Streptococcus thermophilus]|jgi:acyl carrier protein|nr:hypothetical protein [Streptococcus thermophilus]MCE2061270.1 hypothetical protein [Streptococcus thermophilus]MCE2064472.1 hypothetical protein [Streptococcus thermophilus]MCE2066293.1 hypothetical protein [Streptococcus thermophilus]MCE2073094.1 hypothetical protein [Streptococcus thermophilus]